MKYNQRLVYAKVQPCFAEDPSIMLKIFVFAKVLRFLAKVEYKYANDQSPLTKVKAHYAKDHHLKPLLARVLIIKKAQGNIPRLKSV
ncbi:hypothetical protein [Salinibacillus xinjiangensis]|uniref:Uncharacterized protein n=1 Tax=Salinibacillus xinjiangensis TaxID=1229268 RepID=A0A6G1X8T1_9BACI|nr:hypothetical protein [Salinibacillus xinjiangensis]MRG87280.1 hypothetical protein [Salinibacillus xinjiangensis]